MKENQTFEEFDELVQSAFIEVMEQAKDRFIRQQDYEMAAKIRDLIKYETMEEGEEKKNYMKHLIEFYKIK